MTDTSVSDFELFINHQIKVQEQIETSLKRLEALITVAVVTQGFYELPADILHNYFLEADGLIGEMAKANQANLNNLLRQERGRPFF